MDKSYATIMSEVVNACSKKWSDKDQCYLCECDSNWYTNMYLDYSNNYLSWDTFVTNEILPRLDWGSDNERLKYKNSAHSLLTLFESVGYVQPMLSHERIGEICVKILKGEF